MDKKNVKKVFFNEISKKMIKNFIDLVDNIKIINKNNYILLICSSYNLYFSIKIYSSIEIMSFYIRKNGIDELFEEKNVKFYFYNKNDDLKALKKKSNELFYYIDKIYKKYKKEVDY